jgi:hypothetical protein
MLQGVMQISGSAHLRENYLFMKSLLMPAAAVFSSIFIYVFPATKTPVTNHAANPKIQAAILLDVSNSMDGLIDQARTQLWNMVSVMGRAKCNEVEPQIEIALYEYGRSTNDAQEGYVKQISPFTSDLDQLSQKLFSLTTNGGDEYCGHVIHTSLNQLSWDSSAADYKVIFIAGNEDFLQGNISYTLACTEAKKKGVIVNTIYCGDKLQGIQEHWNLGAECGRGSFTNIDQNAKLEEIITPYDSSLFVLNTRLNDTYMIYGASGAYNFSTQAKVDQLNLKQGNAGAVSRVAVKANKKLYNNSNWDLVDKAAEDSSFITRLDMNTLPDSLKNKSREELKQVIKANSSERDRIQKEILALNNKRDKYIASERVRNVTQNNKPTLETEIEKIIKEQVKRFNMVIR